MGNSPKRILATKGLGNNTQEKPDEKDTLGKFLGGGWRSGNGSDNSGARREGIPIKECKPSLIEAFWTHKAWYCNCPVPLQSPETSKHHK